MCVCSSSDCEEGDCANMVVVLQDEGLMGVEQPGGGEDPGEAAQGVTTFHRIPTDPLQPGTLISPSSVSMVGTPVYGGRKSGGWCSVWLCAAVLSPDTASSSSGTKKVVLAPGLGECCFVPRCSGWVVV